MSMLAVALILESVALIVALYFLTLRGGAQAAPSPQTVHREENATSSKPEASAEVARRTRELGEARAELADLREQLKRLKRERFEQKQTEKGGIALQREREHFERSASQQLEAVRAELAAALADATRLRNELEAHRERKAPPPAHPTPPREEKAVEAVPREPVGHRELNPAEQARLERAEQRSAKERSRANELEREVKRLKTKGDMHSRLYLVVKGELDLARDKYKALEKRLNRTLLEKDLLVRALRQLERESGRAAERTELTEEEVASSDARTEAAQRAEAEALAATQPPESPKVRA
jgi:hypothetical protein